MSQQLDSHSKTRFCPSPTGLLHLGNVRTALFSFLLGKSVGGKFLLRIEDTDRERSKESYTQQLQEDLLWLGLAWDEGPEHDQGRGPYHQSKRGPIYDDYYQRLEAMGEVYPCFCTEEELAMTRKIQRASGKPPRYPGTCQQLSPEQIAAKKAEGRRPTLRFRVPLHQELRFVDLVRGEQRMQSADLGDFIIRRADGTSPFMFCNAIDDALMEVTHVVRGEDHLTNTPRQILILNAVGLPVTNYAHISLIVAADGSKLSKRQGSRSLVELRQAGYLPLGITNYLARLGHYYGHDKFLTLEELAAQFKVSSLSSSPAKFNEEQLNFWQKQAVEHLSAEEFWNWLGEEITVRIPAEKRVAFLEAVKPNIQFPADAKRWVDIIFNSDLAVLDLGEANDAYFVAALTAFERYGANAQPILDHLKNELNIKGKALFQPLRLALTGEAHGPELGKLMALMTPAQIKQRLQRAKQHAENLQ